MRWIYKTVHYELKKEGLLAPAFLDENEIEESLNQHGKSGWELVSIMEISDGILAIFKQPFRVAPAVQSPAPRQKTVLAHRQTVTKSQPKSPQVADDMVNDHGDEEIGVIRIE